MESRWMRIFLFSIVFSVNFVTPLKCYLTGVPWPKECSFLIHERHGTNPACLSAVVLDEYKNPVEVQECSKEGSREMPGGCELLRKKRIVKECSLCIKDSCNVARPYNEARNLRPLATLLVIFMVALSV